MCPKINKIKCDIAFPMSVYLCDLSAAGLHRRLKTVLRNRDCEWPTQDI